MWLSDRQTHAHTDRRRTKWSLCAAMLRRRHNKTVTPSIDHQFANLLPNWTLLPILTLLPNFGGFYRILQRVRLANRGRLLLRTPGPVPFGTCIVLMLRPFFPELVISTDLLSFEYPSVLLFCFIIMFFRSSCFSRDIHFFLKVQVHIKIMQWVISRCSQICFKFCIEVGF